MRILIATDAFPPVCGGSGWSTYELAKGLRARGHHLLIVRPRINVPAQAAVLEYDGFKPIEFRAWAPGVPFLRNYFKNERLYRLFRAFLSTLIRQHGVEIVHAQHLLTGPSGIAAARDAGVPSVCTIRDYWPVCYWSDLIRDRGSAELCPDCSVANMTRCVQPHAGALWPAVLPAIPYMRANLALKRRSLAAADAVIAVSGSIARDLRTRVPELRATRIETIHNPVDVEGIRRQASVGDPPMAVPYALFVGKLEPNKGASKLPAVVERSRLDWPLAVVGDGSERSSLEGAMRAAGRDVRFTGWLPREDVLRWLRHAGMLIFPSHGPESLSRVLLEASVLGIPIAAMDTGGTSDIVVHGETGLLSRSTDALAEDVARLRADQTLRARLGDNARRRIEERFDASVVIGQVEALYTDLLSQS